MSPNIFLLKIQELQVQSNTYTLQVRWHSKIKDVKDLLHAITGVPPARQQLFQSNSAFHLSASLTLHDLKISETGHTLLLSIIDSAVEGTEFYINSESSLNEECSNLLSTVRFGLQRQNIPVKTDLLDCTG